MMRRISARGLSSILVCTGTLAIGCSDSHTTDGGGEPVVEVLQGHTQAQPTCVDHASPGRVALRWLDAGKQPVNKDKDISVVVKNPSQDPVTLSAFASASGPGRKERRLALGTHTLASGEEKTLAIRVAALPVHNRICTVWRSAFNDAGFGEDYATESGTQSVPASFSYARIETTGGSTVWAGYLDADGCTPVLSLGGSYYLNTKPSNLSGTSRIDVITGVSNGGPGTYLYLHTPFSVSGLNWPPGSVRTRTVTPSVYGGAFQNSAAVASRVMAMPDNGLAANTTINLWMAQGCPGYDPWYTCASGSDVYIGTAAPNGGQ